MTTVIWKATGRVVVCDDDVARHWIAVGLAVPSDVRLVETASRTTVPQPARHAGTETR